MTTKPTYEELEQRIEELESSLSKHIQQNNDLQESEGKYSSMIENIDIGTTIVDPDLNIIFSNNTIGKWFDKDPKEFIGKKCYREFEKRDQPCPHCPGLKAMKTGEPCEVETEGVREDDSRFVVRDKAFPLYGKNGEIIGFNEVIEDITERKIEELIKEALIEKLQKAADEIKSLQGIVPICMHCKQIRDDKGFWNRVETYIEQNTEAKFSHGICPSCLSEFHPDIAKK